MPFLTGATFDINVDATSLEAAITLEKRTRVVCLAMRAAEEGVSSFLAKRPPKYGEW